MEHKINIKLYTSDVYCIDERGVIVSHNTKVIECATEAELILRYHALVRPIMLKSNKCIKFKGNGFKTIVLCDQYLCDNVSYVCILSETGVSYDTKSTTVLR